MAISEGIIVTWETATGSGMTTVHLDLSPGAPSPYTQIRAALQQAMTDVTDPTFEATINGKLGADALADRANVTAAQVASVLQDITARIAQIDNRRTVITADLGALGAANTAAFKQIVGRMLSAEDDTLFAERRELNVLERLIKAIRRLV